MLKTANIVKRNYKTALPYVTEVFEGDLGQKDEKIAKAESGGPYFIRNSISIIIEEMA